MFGFKKKIKSVELVSPVNGKMICLKDVPDKVFASEMMGPGVAFISSDGKVYSPCDGELVTVFPTKHALGIKTNNGVELLLHFGLDTVNLEVRYSAFSSLNSTYTLQPLPQQDINHAIHLILAY